MSGHSKWSQIKRQKGVTDIKKGQAFTKLGSAISLSVKQGGGSGDPAQNFRLRLAIEAAKTANMPRENIERAIKRGLGREEGSLEEVVYEGFAPGGIALIVEAATDNHMRTTAEIKSFFNKEGGTFAQPGAVSYQFKEIGRIIIPENAGSFEDIFIKAADAGAENIEQKEEGIVIDVPVVKLIDIKNKLAEAGYVFDFVDIIKEPINKIEPQTEGEKERALRFIEKLEEKDDVQKVYSNIA